MKCINLLFTLILLLTFVTCSSFDPDDKLPSSDSRPSISKREDLIPGSLDRKMEFYNRFQKCMQATVGGGWQVSTSKVDPSKFTYTYRGCYKENGNSPFVKDTLYYYNFSLGPLTLGAKPKQFDFSKCLTIEDKCKSEKILEEFICIDTPYGKEKSIMGVSCGSMNMICNDGRCINKDLLVPDLKISKIYKTATSEKCSSFYTFEICNIGDYKVDQNFMITVTSKGVTIPWEYKVNLLGEIATGKCIDIKEPQAFSIQDFNTNVKQSNSVTVKLNSSNAFPEKTINNNTLTKTVSSGDNFYYSPGVVCSATCWETDDNTSLGGVNIFEKGSTSYTFAGNQDIDTDVCVSNDPSETKLHENYCVEPILLPNGNFTKPAKSASKDCLYAYQNIGSYGKCEDGECVPIDVIPSCIDYEGQVSSTIKGTIEVLTVNNEELTKTDTCSSTEVLKEWYCDDNQKIMKQKSTNCYNEYIYDGVGNKIYLVCNDGACVQPSGEGDGGGQPSCTDFEKGSDGIGDPKMKGTVSFTKIDGTTSEKKDKCSGDKLMQYYCPTPYSYNYKLYDCSLQGEACVNGVCVSPDPSLIACEETGDSGQDPSQKGTIDYTDAFGVNGTSSDECLGNTLVELFCNENVVDQFTIDCTETNQVCLEGICTTP
ncbi:MAG: hypothetical protein ISR65_10635 [Bacteriovoracaceae bacterium]|nr:hypothetical protein [Bacteriovoracaceae bacterium]